MLYAFEVSEGDSGELLERVNLPRIGTTPKFEVIDISGLDPVPANVLTGKHSNRITSYVKGVTNEVRNIIITMGLRSDNLEGLTIDSLRSRIYEIFTVGSHINLRFYKGEATRRVYGYVESIDSPMFTKEPIVQISVICPLPHFSSSLISFEGVSGPLNDLEYPGNAPAPFGLTVTYASSASRMTLYINEIEVMHSLYAFQAGDRLLYSTDYGNKYLRLIRGGSTMYILDSVARGRFDVTIEPRSTFRIHTGSGRADPFKLDYLPRYIGV